MDLIKDMNKLGLEVYPKRPSGFGITVAEFARRNDCSVTYARKVLNNAVELGLLKVKIMRLDNKRMGRVYYKE